MRIVLSRLVPGVARVDLVRRVRLGQVRFNDGSVELLFLRLRDLCCRRGVELLELRGRPVQR